MALSIPDYPDPQDVPGVTIPAVYAWIAELTLAYSADRASLDLWIHQSEGASDSWPDGTRIAPIDRLRIACGDPVPGHPDAVFPGLDAVMGRAAEIAAQWMADAGDAAESTAAALTSIATGGAIRASLYAYLRELVYPTATEVD
jgi:hypothetical protein